MPGKIRVRGENLAVLIGLYVICLCLYSDQGKLVNAFTLTTCIFSLLSIIGLKNVHVSVLSVVLFVRWYMLLLDNWDTCLSSQPSLNHIGYVQLNKLIVDISTLTLVTENACFSVRLHRHWGQ